MFMYIPFPFDLDYSLSQKGFESASFSNDQNVYFLFDFETLL